MEQVQVWSGELAKDIINDWNNIWVEGRLLNSQVV